MSPKMKSKTARRRTRRANNNNNRLASNGDSLGTRFGLPARYPLPTNDVVPANFKFSFDLSNTIAGACLVSLAYGVGVTSGSTLFLDELCSGFKALSSAYSRFLIKRLKLEVLQTTPLTQGGYAIANYEAIPSLVPTSVSDVANAVHVLEATPSQRGSFVCYPTDYYNEWRSTGGDGETDNAGRMGSSQIIINNQSAVAVSCALVTCELEMVFAGYRL